MAVGRTEWAPPDDLLSGRPRSPRPSAYNSPQMFRPILLGHRGARANRSVPENTFQSFDLALAHGCDGFEFDLRRTADGRAVICHDPEFQGVTIAEAKVGQLDALPRLDELLARYAARAFLDIELKVTGLEQCVLTALKAHPPERGYVISSFLPEVLRTLGSRDSELPLGLLCEDPTQLAEWKNSPAQFVILHFTLIDGHLCTLVHAAGKKIFSWTVNGGEAMRRLKDYGVDGIISDETRLLVEVLGS
jgi:glycerophosphoryl diester phosphodiesterase